MVDRKLVREQYQLKATFFFNQLELLGFSKLFSQIVELVDKAGSTLDWSKRGDWGIDEEAWTAVASGSPDRAALYFIHPNVLAAYPEFVRYYRCINLIPLKGIQRMTGVSSIAEIEEGTKKFTLEQTKTITETLNEGMSLLTKLTVATEERLQGMMYATAGTMIDGSWRNQIGAEGERVIRALLVKSLSTSHHITSVGTTKGDMYTAEELADKLKETDLPALVNDIRLITCVNGTQIIFGSEPDVELRSADGSVLGGVEVKAGLDPAGALERLGAMLKSFEAMIKEEPSAQTILVASCITPEVQRRLNQSRLVSQTFILTDVIGKGSEGKAFVNAIRTVLGLVERRF